MQQRLSYHFTRPVSGSDVPFWQAWAPQPVHMAATTVRLTPNPRFYGAIRARFQSATRWPQYGSNGVDTKRAYGARRPALVLADVSVHKRLLGPLLEASILLRNLTNTNAQVHPAGPESGLTFYIQLKLSI